MSRFSKIDISPSEAGTIVAGTTATLWYILNQRNNAKLRELKKKIVPLAVSVPGEKGQTKVAVDKKFLRELKKICRICCPGIFTKECGLTVSVALALIARTWCDLWSIENYTTIESSIIAMDTRQFKKHISQYILLMPLLALTNNVLKYSLHSMKLAFRVRLTKYLYDQYLRKFTYYKMTNLDTRIANADQLLTQDVEKVCDTIAELYSNLSKPILDIAIYSLKLTNALGAQAPISMLGYLLVSGSLLTHLRRPISKMTVQEQQYEGEYRYVNSRLITNSEEIAFYQGNEREKQTIAQVFDRLVNHLKSIILFRFTMGFVDNIVAKYLATLVGFYIVSRPFFAAHSRFHGVKHSDRLEDYYKSGRMLLKMSEAIGRVALAGRELSRLAGLTSRVSELMDVLKDVNNEKFKRPQVESFPDKSATFDLNKRGKIIEADSIIQFEHVPLLTPNGDVLIADLSFTVKQGENVLVRGPNGCGKSSLFRVLGELWPLFGGTLTKPSKGNLFYIPQRPYMTPGTLRDQVIYPDNVTDMRRKKLTDDDLKAILAEVQLTHILDRESGGLGGNAWNTINEWSDVLSGGEKQRVAMARLFYHAPQFAILDECTSAVSADVEKHLYELCREKNITLFTVSHRDTLWVHHEWCLKVERQQYEFYQIPEEMKTS